MPKGRTPPPPDPTPDDNASWSAAFDELAQRAAPILWYAALATDTKLGRVGYLGVDRVPSAETGQMALAYDIDHATVLIVITKASNDVYALDLTAADHLTMLTDLAHVTTAVLTTRAAPTAERPGPPACTPRDSFWLPWSAQARKDIRHILAAWRARRPAAA